MSQEAEIMYELERQRREQLFRTRVRNKTQEFYQRYRQQYEDMCSQGYNDYIPDEMHQFGRDLDTISELLTNDPAAARQVSQEVGSYVHSLWGLGKEVKQTFHETARIERERIKQEKAEQQSASLSRYYTVVSDLDSIVANFALNDLSVVKQAVLSGEISTPQEVDRRLGQIIPKAKEQATAWKEKKQQDQQKQSMVAQIEEQVEVLKTDNYEDKIKAQAIMDKLADIKIRATKGVLTFGDMKDELREVTKESDEAFVEENVRREVVVAICKWFSSHNFTVSKPRLDKGNVIIIAQRPSGNKARFILRLDNKMIYRLDGYEGQSCLKDISSAKADWESVYGIKLKDETANWQNPDRILRQQNQTSSSRGGNM